MIYFDIRNVQSPGYDLVEKFYISFFKTTVKWLKKYHCHLLEISRDHGFIYGEQQVKTYLTLALGEISDGYMMQENPINRNVIPFGKRNPLLRCGWTDYWVTVKSISYMIEVKDGMIQYLPEDRFFDFQYASSLLRATIKQVRNTSEKMNYRFGDHLFGLGLVVCPIYCKGKRGAKLPSLKLNTANKEALSEGFRKLGANACAVWALPKQYILPVEDNSSKPFQWIGMAFIGKFIKLSRKP